MATLSTKAATNSGQLSSVSNASYAAARDGSGTVTASNGSTFRKIGQNLSSPTYECAIVYAEFDTSSIAAGATISSASVSVWNYFNETTTDFTLRAYLYDYGASLTNADWQTGSALSGLTLLANISTSSLPTDDTAYLALTDVALPANIVKAGTTRILLCSSRQVGTGTTPTNGVTEDFYTYVVDATKGIKLDVTYTVSTRKNAMGMAGVFGV